MLKAGIITHMAHSASISKTQAAIVLNAFISQTTHALEQGQKVSIKNFGTFYVHCRNERAGANPQNGNRIVIKAKKVVKFKPAAVLGV